MWTRITVASIVGIVGASNALADDSGRRYFEQTPSAPSTALPFSQAVMVANTLYVAGHIGADPKTQKVDPQVDAEAHAVMDAVQHTIASAGLQMDDLVAVTVYCTDLELYDAFNAVYRTYFHGHYPARAFIGVKSLVRGAHFEVSGIATKPLRRGPATHVPG
jgi:2-iminobutanoate/2-iminopropanoate deaminase